jgi:hypothetical protein
VLCNPQESAIVCGSPFRLVARLWQEILCRRCIEFPNYSQRSAARHQLIGGLVGGRWYRFTMSDDSERKSAANIARTLAVMCVRNTFLEELHSRRVPVTKTGDYSDVRVVHAEGEIPWAEVSRFDNDEMKRLMKQMVDRLYTFFLKADDPYFQEAIHRWASVALKWDEPELDRVFLNMIEQRKSLKAD